MARVRCRVLLRRFAALLVLLAAPALAQEPSGPGLFERPVLALDPGMHTAPIIRADVDRSGSYAVTGSDDHTVRVWSLADGTLLRTIRLPVGPGNVGEVNAVAISPDGALIAAGGWTRWTDADPTEQIYLFARDSGKMLQGIAGLPTVVLHLTFSADGRHLAAVLGGGAGLRVYDREAGWAEVARDSDYGDHSYGAAFAPDGRLATTSYDGQIRLYDPAFRLKKQVAAPGGSRPFGIAFSPDGQRLAVGYFDSTAVDLLEGTSLATLPRPDTGGIDNGNLFTVAWSADGATLYAGGKYADGSGVPQVLAWPSGGSGPPRSLPSGLNTVMSLKGLPDGGLLIASLDPYLAVLAADGKERWAHRQPQADFRGQRFTLGVSQDGSVVDFGYRGQVRGDYDAATGPDAPARFDLATGRLELAPARDGQTKGPVQDGLAIEHWINSDAPTLDGRPLALQPYETSRSLAIHPDGRHFVLGTEWWLRAYDATSKQLWRQPVPGIVWAVNISGEGRLVVAAHADGTIRWHRMDDGQELLAFFPMADRKRWVAWTPEGYYASSPGAAAVLGWHVNRGSDKSADFYPITAYGGFYQAKALPLVLQQLDVARALGLAKIAYDREQVQHAVNSPAPPGPQLHVLAVGISQYEHSDLKLDFADDDARELANALIGQEGALYARVHVQALTDDKATQREVLRALRGIRDRMQEQQGDVVVIGFSGHGAIADGRYFLLPYDVEVDDEYAIADTGIPMDELKQSLARLGELGKVLVLLDACHSGSGIAGSKDGLPPDIETVRSELAAAGNGVIVLTSSQGQELSKENPDWQHGAFTKAVLEALKGPADSDGDGWLNITELEAYVERRVHELTDFEQHPQIGVIGEHHYLARLFVAGR